MGLPRKQSLNLVLHYHCWLTDLIHHIAVLCRPTTTWSSAMLNKLFYFSNSYWLPSAIPIACSPLSLYLFLCFASLLLADDCFLLYRKEWDPKLPHVILPLCQQVILPTPSHSLLQSQAKRFSVLKLSCLTAPKTCLLSFTSRFILSRECSFADNVLRPLLL